ncbi:hypothetical protein LGQ03_04950 [Loktanella sp. TSTF-M6]|uniref:Holin n=1 Tax=Loktanella gaetbuli TaxID=2881335 RepID=A0ABS8BS61_9RHOB|nr:hypothetical protein [Loktanella gaetbuli]MCB5198579.1 hypothetical protein [Loktanella gaetbuli]
MLNSPKSPFASKTIWGAVAAVIIGLLNLLGYATSEADAETLSQLLTGIAASAAGAVAFYGRIKANAPIKLTKG